MDLDRLDLKPGGGVRLDPEVETGTLQLAGTEYGPRPERVPARLDVSRTAAGHALRLRFATTLHGPCFRCLEDVAVEVGVDALEVNQPGTGDEDLTSPYVDEDHQLDLDGWAHDALALALPAQLLCREDCAGLCGVCGASLNDADPEEHKHETGGDPRFAKLSELLPKSD